MVIPGQTFLGDDNTPLITLGQEDVNQRRLLELSLINQMCANLIASLQTERYGSQLMGIEVR